MKLSEYFLPTLREAPSDAEVISHLVDYWDIASLPGLTGDAAKAQDYVCGLSAHFLSKAEKVERVLSQLPQEPFSWIFERCA